MNFYDALEISEVHWELTNHCNLKCVHCYLSEDTRRELSTSEIKRIMDELFDAGCLWLTLSGGEPLLRRDFSELYQYAHQKGFLLNIFTNGTKISPEIVELFIKYPPRTVEITLNGITAETFESVTAISGSFKRCISGIKSLHQAGVSLALKTNGMSLNIHEVLEIKGFAQSLKGVQYKFDTAIMPKRDHDPSPTQYRLKPEQIINLYEDDLAMKNEIQKACHEMSLEAPPSGSAFTCSAAKSRFHISAWGDLHPCHTVRPIRSSLLENSFQDAKRKVQAMVAMVQYPKQSKCGSCKVYSQCDSCPGLAHLENKDAVLSTDYHCDVAHELVNKYSADASRGI